MAWNFLQSNYKSFWIWKYILHDFQLHISPDIGFSLKKPQGIVWETIPSGNVLITWNLLLIYYSQCSLWKLYFWQSLDFELCENTFYLFKPQPPKMVRQTQVIRLQQPANCLSLFDHFVGLGLKGLIKSQKIHKNLSKISFS